MKKRTDQYASFKDPAARVFSIENEDEYIFRELHRSYLPHYFFLKSSGLSQELIKKKWLIPFDESAADSESIILKARKINFVSWPYEWTFTQWKDAALLTLKIQYQSLKYGMVLKDATPFNIIFEGDKPVFVDISSFEILKEGQPWQAFKQFCENFYIPLLLVKYFDAIGNDIFLNNINGISLNKGFSLLPAKAFMNFNTLLFLIMPMTMRKYLYNATTKSSSKITAKSLMQFTDQLFSAINKIHQPKQITKWNDYYDKSIDKNYLSEKEFVISNWIRNNYKNKTLVDFGCNTGNFSKLVSSSVEEVIAFDEDMRSVDQLYIYCKENKVDNISCFTANIIQPTPAIGWNNMERPSLKERLKADIGLILALVHHFAISNHIQFNRMADFFAENCTEIFIEFVPKEDAKVQLLLKQREDIFFWYNEDNFLAAFQTRFLLLKEHRFSNNRILFHFRIMKNEQ